MHCATLRRYFDVGIEQHAFFAVRVQVAEETSLPAAEAVPRHRTGIGMLMPTMPTSMLRASWRAM